jgi:hypothetical protein
MENSSSVARGSVKSTCVPSGESSAGGAALPP